MKLETIEAPEAPALTASELVLAKRGHMSSATFSARGGECRLYGGEVREIHFGGPAADGAVEDAAAAVAAEWVAITVW